MFKIMKINISGKDFRGRISTSKLLEYSKDAGDPLASLLCGIRRFLFHGNPKTVFDRVEEACVVRRA